MKLIMAVSKDGYVTRKADDDMSWTGPIDKAAFRMLTSVGGVLGCGSRTWESMPRCLPGRKLVRLSTKPVVPCDPDGPIPVYNDLDWFQANHPNGWLIGGQAIALRALQMDLVDQAYICQSDRNCFPEESGEVCLLGVNELREDHRAAFPKWRRTQEVKLPGVAVHIWNRQR